MGAKELFYQKNHNVIAAIKDCQFFHDFPEDQMKELQEITEYVQIEAKEKLVEEGQSHDFIYFLLKGRVIILVGNEEVSKLQRKGDLVGEMSVVSALPATATYLVDTTSEFLKIKVAAIKKLPSKSEEYIIQNLYKFFAVMLTEKLESTNNYTHQFEMVIRELKSTQKALSDSVKALENKVRKRTADLERKNMALMVSQKQLQDAYGKREIIFKTLEELNKKHLSALKTVLEEVLESAEDSARPMIKFAEEKVEGALSLLTPLTNLFRQESITRASKLLLVDCTGKLEGLVKNSAGGMGVELRVIHDLENAESEILERSYDIVFLSLETISFAKKAFEKNPNMKVVVIVKEGDPSYLEEVVKYPFIKNIISRSSTDKAFNIKNVATTIMKLSSNDYFGIDKYLSWGAKVKKVLVSSSSERKDLNLKLNKYFKSMNVKEKHIDNIKTVAEELLMNMIYDAPISSDGKSLYNHIPRTQEIILKEAERGQFVFACDGVTAAVSAIDPFGGLNRQTVLDYLKSCYEGQAGCYNEEKGGAGMGLYQIMRLADLVVFNVSKGVSTEVIALFNLESKGSDQNQYPSFHFFSNDA